MNNKISSRILDQAVDERMPENLDLTDRIMERARLQKTAEFSPRVKFIVSFAITIVGLVLLSTMVYAIYHFVFDPGIRSVQDAELVTHAKQTAQPTIFPTNTLLPLPAAVMDGESQTREGVTMTLDWGYLDSMQFLFKVRHSELPEGVSIGIPAVVINGKNIKEEPNNNIYMRSNSTQTIFLSNQVTLTDTGADKVDVAISIPIIRKESKEDIKLTSFDFHLMSVPLNTGTTVGFQYTRSVNVDGAQLTLKSIIVNPKEVEIIMCGFSTDPTNAPIQEAKLSGDTFEARYAIKDRAVSQTGCRSILFDGTDVMNARQLDITVNKNWRFEIEQPLDERVPGVKEAIPTAPVQSIEAMTIDDVTLTLDWVYADARRIAFGYTVSGFGALPDQAILGGTTSVVVTSSNRLFDSASGSSTIEVDPGMPDVIHGTWSTILDQPLDLQQISLEINITLDGSNGVDWNHIIGNIIRIGGIPEGRSSQPIVIPTGLIGTYTFETTTQVYPMAIIELHQQIDAEGIRMELVQAELTPSTSNFILCYEKPSPTDWLISSTETSLLSGVETASIEGYALLSDSHYQLIYPGSLPPSSLAGQNIRCAKVSFNLGHANQARTITLTIPGLERSSPEVFSTEEMDIAFAKLREKGIEMKQIAVQGVGGGGGTWEYTRLPESMTEAEAYLAYLDALGYRVEGPWVFTFSYQP